MLTIAKLGRAMREESLTPSDLVEAGLSAIARHDAKLNAVITPLADLARAQAKAAGAELTHGIDRGPLHGIPVGIKDLIDVAGVPTTYASGAIDPVVPALSAPLVERLRGAGAVLLAKTNLLEFAYGSVHPAFGQTNNPWDVTRTSGGPSSGAAAGVCAGYFHGAVGTDTGGSIRVPASYCGIVSLKPSYGLVDTTGIFPLSWSLDHAGPMARTPACIHALLDGMTAIATLGPALPLKGLRCAVVRQHRDDFAVRRDVADAFDGALERLAEGGVRLCRPRLPDRAACGTALINILLPEASVIHQGIHSRRPEGYGEATRRIIEAGFDSSAVSMVRAERFRQKLRGDVEAVFDEVDVLLAPTVAWVAPAEDPPVAGDEGDLEMRFLAPWNLTGHPALSLPCGFGESGLPVGLQMIGPVGGDAVLLRRAEAVHRHLDLPMTPPGFGDNHITNGDIASC